MIIKAQFWPGNEQQWAGEGRKRNKMKTTKSKNSGGGEERRSCETEI